MKLYFSRVISDSFFTKLFSSKLEVWAKIVNMLGGFELSRVYVLWDDHQLVILQV